MIQIDIPMPKNCYECICSDSYGTECLVLHKFLNSEEYWHNHRYKPSWCPLQETDEDDRK